MDENQSEEVKEPKEECNCNHPWCSKCFWLSPQLAGDGNYAP